MTTAVINEHILHTVNDRTMPSADRADILIFNICEAGTDLRGAVNQLITDADVGREAREKEETAGKNALAVERFQGMVTVPPGFHYAAITRGRSRVLLPCGKDDVAEIKVGENVLVDLKAEQIIGKDGQLPESGEVVPIDSVPDELPGRVVVTFEHRRRIARLHEDLLNQPEKIQPGKEVVFDPATDFVIAAIETGDNGDDLLTSPESIAKVTRREVGAPKPVVDEMLDRIRQFIRHPDWAEIMQARDRCSYLFSGGTGSGKSFSLKLIANEYHDLIEEMTGQRTSRLVMVDASQFWTPLFGETEQRISRWAKKLEAIGSRVLRGKDGREYRFPLLVALEECEALLRSRSGEQGGSHHLFDRPLALLLQKTESLESALQVPIIWVASSNRPDLADAAALRRMGLRQVCFGSLRAGEAVAVLKKKVPDSMKVYNPDDRDLQPRETLLRKVVGYLYGPEPKQGIAEVRLGNSDRRVLNRSDVVTPAVLEEAVSTAVDRCLRKSNKVDRLLGLDVTDVIAALHRHFCSLARMLRPHNVAEHATEWFENERPMVTDVVPLVNDRRRPAPLLVS